MEVDSFMAVYKIELKAQGRPNLADGISLKLIQILSLTPIVICGI